jgi:hypothetical protein
MRVAVLVVACGIAIGIVTSCSEGPTAAPCTDIPPGGCPISRVVACDDPACEAVYACRLGNEWELTKRCPPREAGAARDAYVPPPPSFDASFDAPPGAYGGPGCGSLQPPDCALGVVLGCNGGCCGCEDLFVCENGGWELWGTCAPDGGP